MYEGHDVYFHGEYYDSPMDINLTDDGQFTEEQLRKIADEMGYDYDFDDKLVDLYNSCNRNFEDELWDRMHRDDE